MTVVRAFRLTPLSSRARLSISKWLGVQSPGSCRRRGWSGY